MPFFLIIAVWALCFGIGVLFLLFAQTRFLASYCIFCASSASLSALLISTSAILIGIHWANAFSRAHPFLLIGTYLVSIVLGGLIGLVPGFVAARWLNRKLGWS